MKYPNCTSFFQAVNANNVLCTILYPKFLLFFGWLGEFVIKEVSKHHHWVMSGFRCYDNFTRRRLVVPIRRFGKYTGHIFKVKNLLGLLDPKNIRWVKLKNNADHKLQNSLESHNLFSSIRLQDFRQLLQCWCRVKNMHLISEQMTH
jgi:hypothetical protein